MTPGQQTVRDCHHAVAAEVFASGRASARVYAVATVQSVKDPHVYITVVFPFGRGWGASSDLFPYNRIAGVVNPRTLAPPSDGQFHWFLIDDDLGDTYALGEISAGVA